MDILCNVINHSNIVNDNVSTTKLPGVNTSSGYHANYNAKTEINILEKPNPEDEFEFIVTKLLTPSLCIFGIVGNLLNLFILFKRVSDACFISSYFVVTMQF